MAEISVITIKGQKYYSIDAFTKNNGVTERTVYNWVKEGKVEKKKMFNTPFFRLK